MDETRFHEILLNGSIVLLIGSFIARSQSRCVFDLITRVHLSIQLDCGHCFVADDGPGHGIKMTRHPAKRVQIVIGKAHAETAADALIEAGGTGFTQLPVSGGAGRSGQWTRQGQVSTAGGMTFVVCIVREEKLDTVLETAFKIVERHIGVVGITDCEVLRAKRF